MSYTTTDLSETTRPDDITTTSDDVQSKITNDYSAINDYAAASTSAKSTTFISTYITPSSTVSIPKTTPCSEQCSSTCTCSCPKTSVTLNSNTLINQLKIDKKTLSSYKRRLQSATDHRISSYYIGCVGITVFSVTVGFIVLLAFYPEPNISLSIIVSFASNFKRRMKCEIHLQKATSSTHMY